MGFIVFKSLLPVLIVIATGLVLRKSGIVPEEQWRGIESLSYWLLFPVLVMVSLINMDLSNIDLSPITKSYLLAIVTQIIMVWLLRKPLHRHLKINDRSFSSIFQTATRWNPFIALAVAEHFVGDQGVAIVALVIAIALPILNIVNVVMLTICCSDTKPTVTEIAINTFKVPFIWGVLFGLLFNLTHVTIYGPLLASFDIIGRAGLGIGLLTIGAGLHTRSMLNAGTAALIGIVAKLLVFPLLVLTSCMIFGVNGLTLQILMLCASVPTAMNGYILARQMGGDSDLYATTASLQVVISIISIPLMFWLGSYFI